MTVELWSIEFPDYWVSPFLPKNFDSRSIQRQVVNMWNCKRTAAVIRNEEFDQADALNTTNAEYADLLDKIVEPGSIAGQDEPFVQPTEQSPDPYLTMESIRARYPFMPSEIKSMKDRLMEEKLANITSFYLQSHILSAMAEVPLRLAKTLETEVIDTTVSNMHEACVDRMKRITLYGQQVLSAMARHLEDLVNGEEYVRDKMQAPEPYPTAPNIDFESESKLKEKGEPAVEDGVVVLHLISLSKVSADEWSAVLSGYKRSIGKVTINGVTYKEFAKVPIWFSNTDPKPSSLKASIGPDGGDNDPKIFRFIHPYGKYGVYLYVCRHPNCSFVTDAKTTMHRHQVLMKHAKIDIDEAAHSPPSKRSKTLKSDESKNADRVVYEANLDTRPVSIARSLSSRNKWLTDTDIDFYGNMINKARTEYLVMPCTFYPRYHHSTYNEVAHWTDDLKEKSLFDYSAVFFPINHNRRHWTLGYLNITPIIEIE